MEKLTIIKEFDVFLHFLQVCTAVLVLVQKSILRIIEKKSILVEVFFNCKNLALMEKLWRKSGENLPDNDRMAFLLQTLIDGKYHSWASLLLKVTSVKR